MKYYAAILAMFLVTTAGCGSQPLERHEYLLRPPEATSTAPNQARVRLRQVQMAAYLDQDGIVLLRDGSDLEIHVGKQHRWAEPLEDSVTRFLQVAIADAGNVQVEVPPLSGNHALPTIRVRIHQMHGTESGRNRLVAEWTITDADGEVRRGEFQGEDQQQGDGYAALVDAQAGLLTGLAGTIAGDLN